MEARQDTEVLSVNTVGAGLSAPAAVLPDPFPAPRGVSTLPPADPEERLDQWLRAGLDALGAACGLVLLDTDEGLVVRSRSGEGHDPLVVAGQVHDGRVAEVLTREAMVASLGGPAAPAPNGD